MRRMLARLSWAPAFNACMPQERSTHAPSKEKCAPAREAKQEKGGRSGEGARSVIPHLRADMKARAVAKIAKRTDAGF